jgi:site-specific DNA-methyltransferase (adenine-specific)
MLNLPQNPQFCQTDVSGSTFVNADCFDVFPFIEGKSIDAIICDLPYGTTACKWDSILPLEKLWSEYKRVLKPNGVILLTASQPFTTVLIGNDLKMFKYNLVWDKVAITNPMLAKKQPMRCHEDVLVFYDKQPTYNPQMRVGVKWIRAGKKQHTTDTLGQSTLFNNGSDKSEMKYPKSIITFSNADKTKNEHPTQKPIALMEYLVKTYTNEGDTVLDNTMGSGTTNLACIKLNRKSIGIEKEKQYYDVAVRRASEYCH